jgi:hypothetical protein
MAVQETRVLPAPFIEAGGKTFLEDLQTAVGKFKDADLSKIFGPQFVAGQDQLQKDAQQLAISGIGGYQPFLQAAAASAGPTGFQQFMSPYQQDVIDTTLKEFDVQAQKGIPGLAASAIGAGAFGGGREGVQRAVYGSESDRNRAALAANLRERGFQQAQQLAQQNIANQLRLGGAQQGFLGQDVGVLSTLGGANQAQAQAELDAQQQLAQQQLNQPLTAAQQYGSGVTSLIAGYPGQTRQTNIPSPSAIQTGSRTGSTLAGIYRLLQGPSGGLFG